MNHYRDFVQRATTSYIVCPNDLSMEQLYGWIEQIQQTFVFPSIRIRLYTQMGFTLGDEVHHAITHSFDDVVIDHIPDVSKSDILKIEEFIKEHSGGDHEDE